jgi:hypothetical protein
VDLNLDELRGAVLHGILDGDDVDGYRDEADVRFRVAAIDVKCVA